MMELSMKIVCATDLLAKSEAALQRAGLLADNLEADVTLLHVVTPSQSERVLEQSLQMAIVDMKSRAQLPLWRARQKPNIAVRTGSPAKVILDVISQSASSLLILGPHRKRPIRDALEGTVAQKALGTRKCPVLVVHSQPRNPYQRVLFALDPSPASATAVMAAESLVLTAAKDTQVVHANVPWHEGMSLYYGIGFDSVTTCSTAWKSEAEKAVRKMLKCASDNSARYEILIERSCIPTTVRRAIDQYQPDLLVIGTRGRGRVPRALLGSVANRILREVACDTLIVPEGSFERSRPRPSPRRGELPTAREGLQPLLFEPGTAMS
jgi:universal stress protein E